MNFRKRLEKIEGQHIHDGHKVKAIFLNPLRGDEEEPADEPELGWAFSHKGERYKFLKLDGETTDELQTRAAEFAYEITGGQISLFVPVKDLEITEMEAI